MLAENFMSAPDLGISTREHAALVTVLHGLERGDFVHFNQRMFHNSRPIPNGFNMHQIEWGPYHGSRCACFLGWARIVGGADLFVREMMTETLSREIVRLKNLFMFDAPAMDRLSVTVEQAAHGLRNYLTTGCARWEDVLPPTTQHMSLERAMQLTVDRAVERYGREVEARNVNGEVRTLRVNRPDWQELRPTRDELTTISVEPLRYAVERVRCHGQVVDA